MIFEDGPFAGLERGIYRTLLADPPWDFKAFSKKGHQKSAHKHYHCMDLASIKALPVAELAAPNCLLFMWTTAPHLEQAFEVVRAWGFAYSSMGAWAKQSKTGKCWGFGTGYRYRSASEPWLLCYRGKPPLRSRRVRNLIVAPVREHSRKPDQMHKDVEELSDGPRIELFARAETPGWTVWGNEVGIFPPRSVNASEGDLAEAA